MKKVYTYDDMRNELNERTKNNFLIKIVLAREKNAMQFRDTLYQRKHSFFFITQVPLNNNKEMVIFLTIVRKQTRKH